MRSARRWIVILLPTVVVVAVLGIVGAAVLAHRDRPVATELFAYGAGGEGLSARVGHTVYVDAMVQPLARSGHRRMDLRTAVPRVATNTAGAAVQVLLCRTAGDSNSVDPTYNGLQQYCSSVVPFRASVVDLGDPATQVIEAITVRRAGVVRIEGVDVRYAVGSGFVQQQAGWRVIVHATRPSP